MACNGAINWAGSTTYASDGRIRAKQKRIAKELAVRTRSGRANKCPKSLRGMKHKKATQKAAKLASKASLTEEYF